MDNLCNEIPYPQEFNVTEQSNDNFSAISEYQQQPQQEPFYHQETMHEQNLNVPSFSQQPQQEPFYHQETIHEQNLNVPSFSQQPQQEPFYHQETMHEQNWNVPSFSQQPQQEPFYHQETMHEQNWNVPSFSQQPNFNQYTAPSNLYTIEPSEVLIIQQQQQQQQQAFETFSSPSTQPKSYETNLDDTFALKASSTVSSPSEPQTLPVSNQSKTTKSKEQKQKFFTLRRSKSNAAQLKNELKSCDAAATSKISKDTDSDGSDFSDAENQPQSNADLSSLPGGHLQQNRPTTGDLTTKAAPRARFFDRHGLDNYLLNGFKTKSDEHVDIAFNEYEGIVYWANNASIPPFTVKIEDPIRSTKLGGLKAFMEYKIQAQRSGGKLVGRRYKQFVWLQEQLALKYRFICIPPLPGKQIAGRFEQEFVQERKRQLEVWLNRICRHPVLCASFPVKHFLTCELSEKTVKDWKVGKRKIEKDELKEAQWLACVSLNGTGQSDQQILQQIDIFAQQQSALETQLKNVIQGFTKYSERHTEVYEKDIQKVGDLFNKLHKALQIDTTTADKDLSSSIQLIGQSYENIAEFYKSQAIGSLRDFLDHIQEYLGIVQCFPAILSIHRNSSDFMKNIQQRSPNTPDFSNAIHRNHVLNHVVLAEINFFNSEKVKDFNQIMKTLIGQQIKFYEDITSQLRNAHNSFK
ncbi:unnamed protein product [Didymodactylos carnosus]|uniref:PX domain-containing protein n=1 Tax=Didymodactylos carnosus TaxID=1234261 RepID=A0A813P4Y6_9BILA|nr:unnamed protein product [Didymodactylos carnosus]CAF0748285.1 unnamed protein product [Didymodactylos carnosus]CAF3506901.1 unnamed protein product [Didymodactylos carnosus]CAF3527413.1 unnamed protein product [Didymodactylos carnosus]